LNINSSLTDHRSQANDDRQLLFLNYDYKTNPTNGHSSSKNRPLKHFSRFPKTVAAPKQERPSAAKKIAQLHVDRSANVEK